MREMQVPEDYAASSSILEYRRAGGAEVDGPTNPKKAEICGPFDAATIKSLTSRNNNSSQIAVFRAV
jgi:hypothetical protein